jgi:hypothetical protein
LHCFETVYSREILGPCFLGQAEDEEVQDGEYEGEESGNERHVGTLDECLDRVIFKAGTSQGV